MPPAVKTINRKMNAASFDCLSSDKDKATAGKIASLINGQPKFWSTRSELLVPGLSLRYAVKPPTGFYDCPECLVNCANGIGFEARFRSEKAFRRFSSAFGALIPACFRSHPN